MNWKPSGIFVQNASLILAVVLAVFFFCGSPGNSHLDHMESEPEPEWTEYLAQGDWAQQLEDLIGQPQEVWSGGERQMLMLDRTGQWYAITFSRWGAEIICRSGLLRRTRSPWRAVPESPEQRTQGAGRF